MITHSTLKRGLFPLGQTVITPGAIEALEKSQQHPGDFLSRHLRGDWGELCEEDRAANQQALDERLRLMSVYRTTKQEKLWIITEADRSATTLLLPEEY